MLHFERPRGGVFALLFLLLVLMSAVSIDPCPTTVQSFEVTTTAEASKLAAALNCSGRGSFDVQWEGTVIVEETFALSDGIMVTIAGVGLGATVDGGGTTQLFTVANATLYIANVGLENGYVTYVHNGDNSEWKGGAIWAGGVDSVVSCSGTTAFKNNAGDMGGAVSIQDGAVASWSGNTSFHGNVAADGGGALFSEGGVVIFAGETTFTDNAALWRGGTIRAINSEVSWSGVTSFRDSSLQLSFELGGTVQVEGSNLSWKGIALFNGGYGGRGGALYAQGSNVSWAGETVFCDNVADVNGGALTVTDSSTVVWIGETTFCNNRMNTVDSGGTGQVEGGAIYVADSTISWDGTTHFSNNSAFAGGAIYAKSGTSMSWGGTITFVNNTANTNGGAVALVTDLSLGLEGAGTNVSLIGNVAGFAGGAVYQSGFGKGMEWNSVTFVSNSAVNGGAVYSVASGTFYDSSAREHFPNKYDNCTFRDNSAAVSGGAIESVACRDEFSRTTFEGNTAGQLGGCLRLAGTTSLTDCHFVGNGAKEEGPAVVNAAALVVADSSFSNNSLLCATGTFLNYTVEATATADERATAYYYSICEGCGECTGACPTDGNGTQQCIPALENTNSSGVDESGVPITLQTLKVNSGYWRPVPSTASILPCWNEDACLGGLTGAAGYCAEGYRGPYCAICEDGYAQTLAYTCSKCSSGEGIAFAALAFTVGLVAVVAVIVHLVSKPHETKNTRFRQLTQVLPVQGLKTVVVAWQILTQFDAVANVTYAGVYGQFLDGVASIVSLDIGLVISAGCMATTDFHDRLLISTLGPLLALGALGVSFQVAARRNQGSPEALQTVRRKHFSMALLVTFLVYSSVSSTVFRAFDCETLDNDNEYLRADYTIQCTTSKHKAFQVYAAFMIMMYPVGIPVLYGLILFKHREVLQDRRHRSVKQTAAMEVTADLWKPYTPARYYYEVVECARRVTLTGVVVFIYPNTAAQVAVTLVLAFVFVMVSESMAPYASKQDAWMSRVGHIVVFLSMFQALMLKVDVSDESSDSQQMFGGVLLAANICMVAAVVSEATMVVFNVCRRGRGGTDLEESVAPGVRNTSSTRSVAEGWDIIERDGAPTFIDNVPY